MGGDLSATIHMQPSLDPWDCLTLKNLRIPQVPGRDPGYK